MLIPKQTMRQSLSFIFQSVGDFYHGAADTGILDKNFQRDMRKVVDGRMVQARGINVGGVADSMRLSGADLATEQRTFMQINAEFKLNSYWDSYLGSTAGQRLVVSSNSGTLNIFNTSKVNPDGSLEPRRIYGSATQTPNAYIFAETASHLFMCSHNLDNNYIGLGSNLSFSCLEKADNTSTSPIGFVIGSLDSCRVTFDGIYGNLAVFIASDVTIGANSTAGYVVIDLVTRTFKFTKFTAPLVGSNSIGGCTASQGVDSVDGLSRYFFKVCNPATTSDLLRIERWKFSKTLVLADNVSAANRQQCTLVGAPADFLAVMRGAPETPMPFGYVTHAFTENGKTYVTVSLVSGHSHSTRTAFMPNLGTYVFRLEADETTLTFCSKTMYGYMVSNILPTPSQKNLILAQDSNRCTKLQWTGGSESYVQSDFVQLPASISAAYSYIAVDRDENIFFTTYDGDARAAYVLHVWNFNQGASVQAKFANASQGVVWAGSPVDVTVVVNAFDAFGARQARTVNLIIDGAAEFKTGGGTAQQFTTSASEDTQILITVKDAGNISVTPQLV